MDHEREENHNGHIAVAVITPSGTYPGDDDFRRSSGCEVVDDILKKAAARLRLPNTTDWVAFVENRLLEPQKTFVDNDLQGIVEIEWHKEEGGGGA